MLQWLILLNSKVQVKTHIQTNLIYLYILFTIQFIILEISMIYDNHPPHPPPHRKLLLPGVIAG